MANTPYGYILSYVFKYDISYNYINVMVKNLNGVDTMHMYGFFVVDHGYTYY
jgi:hypothetical protein